MVHLTQNLSETLCSKFDFVVFTYLQDFISENSSRDSDCFLELLKSLLYKNLKLPAIWKCEIVWKENYDCFLWLFIVLFFSLFWISFEYSISSISVRHELEIFLMYTYLPIMYLEFQYYKSMDSHSENNISSTNLSYHMITTKQNWKIISK